MVRTHLQILLPPFLGVDQEEPLPVGAALALQVQLRPDDVILQGAARWGSSSSRTPSCPTGTLLRSENKKKNIIVQKQLLG